MVILSCKLCSEPEDLKYPVKKNVFYFIANFHLAFCLSIFIHEPSSDAVFVVLSNQFS